MFLWPCSLAVPVLAGWVYAFVVLCPGTPEGSTGSGSDFRTSQKTGQRLKVSSDRMEEAGNRTCDPWFTRHKFIPYTMAASQLNIITQKKTHHHHSLNILYIFNFSIQIMLNFISPEANNPHGLMCH